MGRKNRKGRRPGENPHRFYRQKREQARQSRRRLDDSYPAIPATGPPDPNLPPPDRAAADPPATDHRSAGGARLLAAPRRPSGDSRRPQARPRVCGRCAEWVPRHGLLGGALTALADRGECLHPGSGFTFPPADMDACPFFH